MSLMRTTLLSLSLVLGTALSVGCTSSGSSPAPLVLAAPGASTLTAGDQSLTAQWAGVQGAASYEVYLGTANDPAQASRVNDPDETDTSCTISNLTNGTTYYVWTKARSGAVSSVFSPAAQGIPQRPALTFQLPDSAHPGQTIALAVNPIAAGSCTLGQAGVIEPLKPVTVSAFHMAPFECTQAQWQALMNGNPSQQTGDLQRPVEMVSYLDITREGGFLDLLNLATAGQRPAGMVFRLPTEAEWEYACRAGSTAAYSFGDDASQLGTYAWTESNSGGATHPVGQKPPNAWGLYDMHGNVQEWCHDPTGFRTATPETDPVGAWTGPIHIVRGGGYRDESVYCTSAYYYGGGLGNTDSGLGFRVVLAPPVPSQIVTVGGYYTGAARQYQLPCIWRDGGSFSQLSSDPGGAEGVTMSDGHIYIAGNSGSSACFWIDGIRTDLDGTRATGLAVSGGVLYTSGWGPSQEPCYWTATTRTSLTQGYSGATGIQVSRGHVHVTGKASIGTSYPPCYWVDGAQMRLSANMDGCAMGIQFQGESTIVAGYYYNSNNNYLAAPCVWTGDSIQTLDVDSAHASCAVFTTGLACDAQQNYVSGFIRNGADFTPCYWVGTTLHVLEASPGGKAMGITVFGGRVYVCGYYQGMPCVWVNGVRKDLPCTFGGQVNAIYVE